MSQRELDLRFSDHAIADLDRIFVFYESRNERLGERATEQLIEGLQILTHSPFVGRSVSARLRELVIGWGASGFVALYHVDVEQNAVLLVAIRHQREAGYGD
ncbi:hypothetical protein IP84_08935 [beta proteobacterium AAP99]|nr:hypothetical protein IP84_08935 [beta proteobacterium AAP99]